MNWRGFVPWMKMEPETTDIIPTKEMVVRQVAGEEFEKMPAANKFGPVYETFYHPDIAEMIFRGVFSVFVIAIVASISAVASCDHARCMANFAYHFVCWLSGSLTLAIGSVMLARYESWRLCLAAARIQMLNLDEYRKRLVDTVTKKIETLALRKNAVYLGVWNSLRDTIGRAVEDHKCSPECGCHAEALRVQAYLESEMGAVAERKNRLIAIVEKRIDHDIEEEWEQIAAADLERSWLAEANRKLQLPS